MLLIAKSRQHKRWRCASQNCQGRLHKKRKATLQKGMAAYKEGDVLAAKGSELAMEGVKISEGGKMGLQNLDLSTWALVQVVGPV